MPRRLGPLDRLRATQGCGIGSSCRSHAALEIESFPVFEARCTGSSNSQTVWPAGLELQLVCDDGAPAPGDLQSKGFDRAACQGDEAPLRTVQPLNSASLLVASCFGLEEPLCAFHQKLPVSARSILALEKSLKA